MRRLTRWTGFGFALALALVALAGSGPALATDDTADIVFTRANAWDPDRRDILVMDADGSNVRTVRYRTKVKDISLSPDGTQIVWSEDALYPEEEQIYVINVDGTGRRQLYSNPDSVIDVAWSPAPAPDGEYKIAFCRGIADVWLINPDGTGLQNLTLGAFGTQFKLAWSPDATRIALRKSVTIRPSPTRRGTCSPRRLCAMRWIFVESPTSCAKHCAA